MKCEKCGIEMRIDRVEDGEPVWVCRNPKCTEHQIKEEEARNDGAD